MTDSAHHEGELERQVTSLYSTLKRMAAARLRREGEPQAVEPTELVHECFLRLARTSPPGKLERTEFLALAARVIRRVLVDQARVRRSQKRGGDWSRIEITDGTGPDEGQRLNLLDLDAAIERLTALDERQGRVVELRFFAGLSIQEISELLGVSRRTIDNEWRLARAWLRRELEKGAGR